MKTTLTSIGPDKATEFLKRNKTNRPLRAKVVEQYALDMKKGHWLPNHQGIAFDTSGNLIDGQHRLEAIKLANVTVKILVTTGLPVSAENGLTIFTMDTVDRGKLRTVGDQLVLRHNVKGGNLVAAIIQTLVSIVSNGQVIKLTVPTATAILGLYRKEIEWAVEARSNIVGLRSAIPIGATVFALKSDRERIENFYNLLVSGEGLYRTGETSPVYTLRRTLQSQGWLSGSLGRWRGICATLNAAKNFIEGNQLTQLKHTNLGVEFFINRQKSAVAKITEIVTL